MKHRLLSIFLTFAIILLITPNAAITSALADNTAWRGSGTESEPYLISSREEFEAIADAVNSGNDLLGVYFKQTNDIDFGDEEWPTVGITINNAAHQFRGVFDGGDNKIYNLNVNRHDDDAGLFGYVGEDGVIKNVNIEDGDVSGTYWVGGIAGRNSGIVEYCSFSGSVYGNQQYIGGIVGDNHGGTVRYCYNLGDVEFNHIGGGIVGRNSGGTVENCYNRGYVCSNNGVRGYAGGVVGENTADSTVDNCYSDGWVDGSMACGAIVGANGAGSTVKNCFYPEEFEEDGLSGVGGINGTIENVTPKSEEQFDSGEVAWELSQGTNGGGWGQTLKDENGNHDKHPHFTDVFDKDYDTTEVYRVHFTANDPDILPEGSLTYYVDPHDNVDLPQLPPDAAWFVGNEVFDGKDIQNNIDTYAGKRILFAGENGIVHRLTYSPEVQTVDLDMYLKYAEGGPYSEGRFEYTLSSDGDGSLFSLAEDKKTLIVPAGMNVKDGYTLNITAYEKEPFIMPLALTPLPSLSVPMNVKIVIEKATPEISVMPTASDINYGTALSGSTLSGGKAVNPTTGTDVNGSFNWNDPATVPNVTEAAITGYYVTFEPADPDNYNTVTIMVTLTVNKVAPTNVTAPTPINSIYNGVAEKLINQGSADGGTMKYWLSDDPNAEPPENNSEYSSTVPSRANAGTYTVWYKVIGDENHNDTVPQSVTAVIKPRELVINEHVTYNGGDTFTLALEGVTADGAVIAYVTTSDKNAGNYVYSDTAGAGKFTATLLNSNYIIDEDATNTLVIDQLPVVLKWKGPLTFAVDNKTHSVYAEVSNGIEGDTLDLKYEENSGSAAKGYTAKVTGTGDPNYTADPDKGAQNVTQPWRIFEDSKNITLNANPNCATEATAITYGAQLTLTAEIGTLETGWNKVQFYVNNEAVGPQVDIKQIGGKNIATYTIPDATAQNYFSLGANVVRVDYMFGNSDGDEQVHAITVFVKPKPINAKFSNTEKVYDGNDVAAGLVIEIEPQDIEGADAVKITADNYTYNSANAADATTITAHNVTLIGAQSGNYTIANELETSGTITPKTIKPEWRGATGLVYNGNPANVNATATETLPGEKCEIIVDNGNRTNAGRYTATAADVDNSNYQLPKDNTVRQDYEIAKADLYIEAQEHTYNGTKEFAASAIGADGKDIAVKLTASNPNVGDYTYTTDASEGSAYTADTEDINHNIAGGGILTVLKADPDYKAPIALKLPYTGLTQELVTAGTANGGEMQYSLSDGTYYTDIPTGIEEDEYTVWYRVVGDMNHNDVAPQSVEALISGDIHDDPGDSSGSGGGGGSHKPSGSNDPNDQNASDSDTESRPHDPNVSGSDTSNRPSDPDDTDPSGSGDDTTKQPDSSQVSGKVPNTGVGIDHVLYFFILCACGTAVTVVLRHRKQ